MCICICICLIESLVFCYEELITRSHFFKGHGCCEREFLLMHVDVHLNLKPNLDLFSLRDSASFVLHWFASVQSSWEGHSNLQGWLHIDTYTPGTPNDQFKMDVHGAFQVFPNAKVWFIIQLKAKHKEMVGLRVPGTFIYIHILIFIYTYTVYIYIYCIYIYTYYILVYIYTAWVGSIVHSLGFHPFYGPRHPSKRIWWQTWPMQIKCMRHRDFLGDFTEKVFSPTISGT